MKKVFKSLSSLAFAIVMVLSVSCQNDPKSTSAYTRVDAETFKNNTSAYTKLQLGTVYECKGDYPAEFTITPDLCLTSSNDFTSLKGSVVEVIRPDNYPGIVLLVKTESHTNYSPSCYPDYNEASQHKGCYLTIYLEAISEKTIKVSELCLQGYVSRDWTACAKDIDSLNTLIEDNLSTICEGLAPEYNNRGILNKYPKNYLSGIFTVE